MTIIERYAAGERDFSRADLSGADLRGAYLSGADLSRADLSRADLSRADLSRADLSGADLRGAYLSGADLSRADLSRADLSRAYLRGANLSRADLSRADLSGADLSRAYLRGANLIGANLVLTGRWQMWAPSPHNYSFLALEVTNPDIGWVIHAGCRCLTLAEAREHWCGDRGDGEDGAAIEAWVQARLDLLPGPQPDSALEPSAGRE